MLKAPGYNSSLQPAITNTVTANPQRSALGCYILRVQERNGWWWWWWWRGGGDGCTNASGEGGTLHFLKMVSCSHIKFALNDAQTLNETKFDLYKCMMRHHV